jgi:hypothetical protein
VVNLSGVSRTTTPVCHRAINSRNSGGKSDPQSIIQPTDLDCGGGEKSRAPRAEYDPAPPTMSLTGGFGEGNSISSNGDEHWWGQIVDSQHTDNEHAQRAEIDLGFILCHVERQIATVLCRWCFPVLARI